MPRPLSIALIASLCMTFTARAEDKPSPAVKRILDKAVGKVRANRQEFDKANEQPLDDATAELQDLVTKLNKDGKTKEAKDALTQIETLEADVMKSANAPAPGAGRAVPQKPLLERLTGRWAHPAFEHAFHFEANGDFREEVKATGKTQSRGRVVVAGNDIGEIRLDNGFRLQVRTAGDDVLAVLVWEPSGQPARGWVLERIR